MRYLFQLSLFKVHPVMNKECINETIRSAWRFFGIDAAVLVGAFALG
jgi:hypothetical protein